MPERKLREAYDTISTKLEKEVAERICSESRQEPPIRICRKLSIE